MKSPTSSQLLITVAPIIFVLLWSTGYLCGRVLRPHVDPLTFSAFRFGAASLILVALVYLKGVSWPKELKTWFHLSVCGVLIQGFFIAGMLAAINNGLEMGTAALIGGMQPILTAVLAAFWLKERFTVAQAAGFFLGFIGLAMVLWQSLNLGNLPTNGLIISLAAVMGITLGTLYQKRYITEVNLLSGTAIQFAAAFFPVFLLSLALEEGRIDWNPQVIVTAIWLICAQSIGAVLILFQMIRAGAVAKVSSLFYLVPPICAVQGFFLFNESLSVLQMIGIIIVSTGVLIINRK